MMRWWQGWQKGIEQNQQMTPKQKTAEHSAQQWGLHTVSQLLGIENTRGVLRDARQRTCDSHHAQMNAIGRQASGSCEEDMGDINVSGDHYITQQHHRSAAPLWLSGLGAAAAAALITYGLTKPDEPATQPAQPRPTLGVGLEVERGGALPDEVTNGGDNS